MVCGQPPPASAHPFQARSTAPARSLLTSAKKLPTRASGACRLVSRSSTPARAMPVPSNRDKSTMGRVPAVPGLAFPRAWART
eukprot:10490070-Lingulodinium_polyedra.AAC.1